MAVVYFMDYSILGKQPGCFTFCLFNWQSNDYNISCIHTPPPRGILRLNNAVYSVFCGYCLSFLKQGLEGIPWLYFPFLLYIWIAYRFLFGITALIETTICALIIVTAVILKGGFGGRKAVKLSFLWAAPIVLFMQHPY